MFRVHSLDSWFQLHFLGLRVKLGSNIVRLFYFHHDGKTYVVTSGYVKKTQKTNQREIDRAIRLMNEFTGGKNDG